MTDLPFDRRYGGTAAENYQRYFVPSIGRQVDVQASSKDLRLPAPRIFLWQYIHSTPLGEAVTKADRGKLDALEHDVCSRWQAFAANDGLAARVGITTGSAMK